jgi:hypothetical protein
VVVVPRHPEDAGAGSGMQTTLCDSRRRVSPRTGVDFSVPDGKPTRRAMDALLIGYARVSTDEQDLTAQ